MYDAHAWLRSLPASDWLGIRDLVNSFTATHQPAFKYLHVRIIDIEHAESRESEDAMEADWNEVCLPLLSHTRRVPPGFFHHQQPVSAATI
jgi:hypothetical protein